MAIADEDDRPKRKIAHEIGQDLALLSVAELDERIGLLRKQAAVEFGRKVLFSDMRPSFKELDEETKAVKGK